MTILPPSAVDLERALVEVDGRVLRIDADVVRRAKDPMLCPEELLPWLAWEEGVDLWDPDWPVEKKRQVIAQSWEMHRAKGSRQGLVDAINLLNFGAVVEEWFEYGGQPYHFRLTIDLNETDIQGEPNSTVDLARHNAAIQYRGTAYYGWHSTSVASQLTPVLLKRAVMEHKNVRSHLESIHYTTDFLDDIETADADKLAVVHGAAEVYPWGRRYDASINHDHAVRHLHDGSLKHGGQVRYNGWGATGETYGNERVLLTTGVRHAVTDRLGVRLSYDGRHRHNAIFNHGDLQPSVADVDMPIIVRRNVFYDGSRRHGGDIYDGSISHAGSAKYFAGAFYNSPVETILTA